MHFTYSLLQELTTILIIIQRKRLLVSEREKQKFNVEPFQLQKLETNEAREQVKISYSFAVSDKVIDKGDTNRAGEVIGENIKIWTKNGVEHCFMKILKTCKTGKRLICNGCRVQ